MEGDISGVRDKQVLSSSANQNESKETLDNAQTSVYNLPVC